MADAPGQGRHLDFVGVRAQFPATADRAYLNTAAVGLASRALAETAHAVVDTWVRDGFDFVAGERAAERARHAVASIIGADPADVALISSVSAAAGMVASQLGPASAGENVVIGEREYSSNHFPWRQLEHRGYEVRQVPFDGGGLDPDRVATKVDGGTRVVAFSGVQSATGHRSDVAAISSLARAVGALVFVDGSQLVGALPVAGLLEHVDVLATADHKYLLHAGRGMGYCYLAPSAQGRFVPVNAGWRAGADPLASFFGPGMELSSTASRFDESISWLAAHGNVAALQLFEDLGPETVHRRNRQLEHELRAALEDSGWPAAPLPPANRSTTLTVPLGERDPVQVVAVLAEQQVVAAVRDGGLRVSVHVYNDEEDIARLVEALGSLGVPTGPG